MALPGRALIQYSAEKLSPEAKPKSVVLGLEIVGLVGLLGPGMNYHC